MPYHCCVPFCKGNYKNTGPHVSVFQFPEEAELRKKWLTAIMRKGFEPVKRSKFPTNEQLRKKCIVAIKRQDFKLTKNNRVCELHFERDAIAWETSAYDEKTGRTISAPLKVPRLKNGAFPTIFPVAPMYSSISATKPREDPSKKRKTAEKSADRAVKKKAKKLKDPGKSRTKELNQSVSVVTEPTEIAGYIIIKEEPDISYDNPPSSMNGCTTILEEALSKKNGAPFSTNLSSETNPSVDFVFSVADYAVDSSPNIMEDVSTSSNPSGPITNRKNSISKSVENVSGNKAEVHQLTSHSVPSTHSKDELVVNALSSENIESLMGSSEESSLAIPKTNERPRDLFDAFGEYIAGKLRQLDWRSCAYALKAIADVIFKADTKNYDDTDVS